MGAEPGLRDDAGSIEHALGRSRLQTKGDQGRSRIAISRSTERAPLIRSSKHDRRISMLAVKRGTARSGAFTGPFSRWDRGNKCGHRNVEMRLSTRLLPPL